MINTIKLGRDNYLIDKETGSIVDRYDPNNDNLQLVLNLNDSILTVDASHINIDYGKNIIVQYNNDRFIIDDGWQNQLIKAGYIIYKDYDHNYITNHNEGITVRNQIFDTIEKALDEMEYKYSTTDDSIELTVDNDHYHYTIKFDNIQHIVNKNKQRKDNNLTYYPFEKNMDKFGTIYVSVFAQKKAKIHEPLNAKMMIPDTFIKNLVYKLGYDYHFNNLIIKGRVIMGDQI